MRDSVYPLFRRVCFSPVAIVAHNVLRQRRIRPRRKLHDQMEYLLGGQGQDRKHPTSPKRLRRAGQVAHNLCRSSLICANGIAAWLSCRLAAVNTALTGISPSSVSTCNLYPFHIIFFPSLFRLQPQSHLRGNPSIFSISVCLSCRSKRFNSSSVFSHPLCVQYIALKRVTIHLTATNVNAFFSKIIHAF